MKEKIETQNVKAKEVRNKTNRFLPQIARMMRAPALFLSALIILVSLLGASASKVAYPERPVAFIVPFAAGGGGDVAARILAEAAKSYFPQPILIENKTGASGITGISALFQSKPDGYTIGHVTNEVLCRVSLEQSLPFKGPDDFQFIITMNVAYYALVVKSDSSFSTFKDMVANAKANPGKVRLASGGLATGTGMIIEWLKAAGAGVTQVPFAGSAPSITAILGGHVEGAVAPISSLSPFVKAGQLRFLVLFAEKRSPILPDVPTQAELGYKFPVEISLRTVYATPKGTPKDIVNILYETYKKAEQGQAFQKWIADTATVAEMLGPEESAKVMKNEYEGWAEYFKKTK